MKKKCNILLVDNYDSFTFNLYQLFRSFPVNVTVTRNNEINFEKIEKSLFDIIVISPGPGTPKQAGFSTSIITKYYKNIPILGVCLGMQVINEAFGGCTIRAPLPVHGKTTLIHHNGHVIFSGVPSPFPVARYHSLTIGDVPNCFEILAQTSDEIAMALAHKTFPVFGLQFHPESFMSVGGREIIKNFLQIANNFHVYS
ncbi:MAG: anthranilate synthase component II [bacterium]